MHCALWRDTRVVMATDLIRSDLFLALLVLLVLLMLLMLLALLLPVGFHVAKKTSATRKMVQTRWFEQRKEAWSFKC